MGRLSYLVSTNDLAMRGAGVSATMEMSHFSWNIPNLGIRTVFKDIFFYVQCAKKYDLTYTHFAMRLIFTAAIVIIKSFATFNDTYCQQINAFTCSLRSYPSEWLKCSILGLQCLYMISMITNCEIELDGKDPHFTKLQISQWSTVDRRRCGNAQVLSPMKY